MGDVDKRVRGQSNTRRRRQERPAFASETIDDFDDLAALRFGDGAELFKRRGAAHFPIVRSPFGQALEHFFRNLLAARAVEFKVGFVGVPG